MRRVGLGLGIIALGVSAWTACVGDKPADAAQGGADQACYANGTCLGSLICRNGQCEDPGVEGGATSSSSSSSSGSTSSSGNASSSSGSSGSTCTATLAKSGPQCVGGDGGECKAGETCCPAGTATACMTTCLDDGWQCDDQTQCGTGVCCITSDRQIGRDACGVRTLDTPTSKCVENIADCTGLKQYRTCRSADTCVGGDDKKDCVVHDVVTVGGTHVLVGVCEGK